MNITGGIAPTAEQFKKSLKWLDTFGNHRPLFSISVIRHMHKIKNLGKFRLVIEVAREYNGRKKTPNLVGHIVCAFTCLKRLQAWSILIFEWEITPFFKKTTLLQRGSRFSTYIVLCYQQLSIARYKASFYANNKFE